MTARPFRALATRWRQTRGQVAADRAARRQRMTRIRAVEQIPNPTVRRAAARALAARADAEGWWVP